MAETEAAKRPVGGPTCGRPVFLVVHCGKTFLDRPRVLPLDGLLKDDGRMVFGRSVLGELGLQDNQVSSRHFEIHFWGDRNGKHVFVDDLSSKNGFYVDGERVPFPKEKIPEGLPSKVGSSDLNRAEIRDGSLLRCGSTLLVFRELFEGSDVPDGPFYELDGNKIVSPFGLRRLRSEIEGIQQDYRGKPSLSSLNISLRGATGSGKELLARYVAEKLGRSRPFIAINASAIPATLFYSELFGIDKLQNDKPRDGLVARSRNGTLFMDEIQSIALESQAVLLRFLETRDFNKIGSSPGQKEDVLVLAAMNDISRDSMRPDLRARLEEVCIDIPALQDRIEDIPEICKELLRRISDVRFDRVPIEVELLEAMLLHSWPTNVRGLKAILGLLRKKSNLEQGFQLWMWKELQPDPDFNRPSSSITLGRIFQVLKETKAREKVPGSAGKYNYSEAARKLGMDDSTLKRRIGL